MLWQWRDIRCTLLFACLLLVGCAQWLDPDRPARDIEIGPIDGRSSFLTLTVEEVQVLGKTGDFTGAGELRLMIIVSDDEEAGGLLCPAGQPISVQTGDVVEPCTYGLSVPEANLEDDLYVLIVGLDEDRSTMASEFTSDAALGFLSRGLVSGIRRTPGIAARIGSVAGSPLVAGGELLLETAITYAAARWIEDWIAAQNLIGVQGLYLHRDQEWFAGQQIQFTTNNGALRIKLNIHREADPEYVVIEPRKVAPPDVGDSAHPPAEGGPEDAGSSAIALVAPTGLVCEATATFSQFSWIYPGPLPAGWNFEVRHTSSSNPSWTQALQTRDESIIFPHHPWTHHAGAGSDESYWEVVLLDEKGDVIERAGYAPCP